MTVIIVLMAAAAVLLAAISYTEQRVCLKRSDIYRKQADGGQT